MEADRGYKTLLFPGPDATSGTAAHAYHRLREFMGDMGPAYQVRPYVSEGLIRVGPEATVRQMARRLAAEGVGALVVVEGGQVHGIVSERDLMLAIAAGQDLDATTAADLDNRDVVTCTPDTTVHDAAVLMMEHYVRHLLVRDHTGPVGMISARDLLGAYAS